MSHGVARGIVGRALRPVFGLSDRVRSRLGLRWHPARLRNSSGREWRPARTRNWYRALYEAHSRQSSDDDSVGVGHFDLIGRIELGILLAEGLSPSDTVVDFGCGTGRLAVHLIPRLSRGHYIGTDISAGMLAGARRRLGEIMPSTSCRVELVRQGDDAFPLADDSVDMICAFSVFTHMEHEDAHRYLVDARRVVKAGGKFIFSCLSMDLALAQEIFAASAAMSFARRWSQVRTVVTTRELMEAISRSAGWTVARWYQGDEPSVRMPDSDERHALGQSTCVLVRPQ